MDKTQLRSLYTIVRSHIGEDYALKAAQSVVKRFLKEVPLEEGMVIAGYAPFNDELDVMPLLEGLLALGYKCALPVVTGTLKPLEFREWQCDTVMQKNHYQINEPDATSPVIVPDIIITPLLACDRAGARLGYGKGFYDITIAALRQNAKKPLVIGIGYHAQLTDDVIVVEATDQKLDIVLTEKQTIPC